MSPTGRGLLHVVRCPSLCVVVLAYAAIAPLADSPRTGLLDICVLVALYAAMYSLNDWADVATDSVNRPERAIPSGALSRRSVLLLAVTGASLSAILGGLRSAAALGFALAFTATSAAYSLRWKRVLGIKNVAAALLISSVLLYATEIAHGAPAGRVMFVASVLLNCAREIVMDIRDIRGDSQVGTRTLATTFGVVTSAAIAALLTSAGIGFIIACTVAPPPWVFPLTFWQAVAIHAIWFGIVVLCFQRRRPHPDRFIRQVISSYKLYYAALLILIALSTS